jgi:hypothetical protein
MLKRICGYAFTLLLCLSISVAAAEGQEASEQSNAGGKAPQAGSGAAQKPAYRKFIIDFNVGGLNPGGDLQGKFSTAPGAGFNLGTGVHRHFQLDAGFDAGTGAAGVSRTINTTGGPRSVGDTEYFVPLGARFVLPLFRERLLLSGGGGGAYISYTETPKAGANEVVICTSCVSRSGGGAFEVAQIKVMLDKQRRFGVGSTTRWYQASSKGGALGTNLQGNSKDRWTTVAGTLGFHF